MVEIHACINMWKQHLPSWRYAYTHAQRGWKTKQQTQTWWFFCITLSGLSGGEISPSIKHLSFLITSFSMKTCRLLTKLLRFSLITVFLFLLPPVFKRQNPEGFVSKRETSELFCFLYEPNRSNEEYKCILSLHSLRIDLRWPHLMTLVH